MTLRAEYKLMLMASALSFEAVALAGSESQLSKQVHIRQCAVGIQHLAELAKNLALDSELLLHRPSWRIQELPGADLSRLKAGLLGCDRIIPAHIIGTLDTELVEALMATCRPSCWAIEFAEEVARLTGESLSFDIFSPFSEPVS